MSSLISISLNFTFHAPTFASVKSALHNPDFYVGDGSNFDLSQFSTSYDGQLSEEEADKMRKKTNKKLVKLQEKFYAENKHALLVVFQAMDAAGKDSTVRAVFSGMNPAGFQVSSFKSPSKKELDHDYLWRTTKALPERGRIGVFNRSHYEEVLVCKVHPAYVLGQNIPGIEAVEDVTDIFWNERYESIASWERHLAKNGTKVIKFFLNVSKDEQKNRFLSRINEPKKNWKFNFGDMKERALWPKYMEAYQTAIQKTAKPHAPWYVIPADSKPIMRALVSQIICETLEELAPEYPSVDDKHKAEMQEAKEILENEAQSS